VNSVVRGRLYFFLTAKAIPAAAIIRAATTPPSIARFELEFAEVTVVEAVVVTTFVTVLAGRGEICVTTDGFCAVAEPNWGELPATLEGTAPGPLATAPEL
jgi:hypothetical protein